MVLPCSRFVAVAAVQAGLMHHCVFVHEQRFSLPLLFIRTTGVTRIQVLTKFSESYRASINGNTTHLTGVSCVYSITRLSFRYSLYYLFFLTGSGFVQVLLARSLWLFGSVVTYGRTGVLLNREMHVWHYRTVHNHLSHLPIRHFNGLADC